MPGFNINGNKDGPEASPGEDYFRDHRFKLKQFLGLNPDTDNGFISVKEITMPDEIIEQLKISTSSAQYTFAKKITYGELRVTFYGTKKLYEKLKELKKKVQHHSTGIGDFAKYKDEVKIALTDNNGGDSSTMTFKNASISGLYLGTLSYTSSEIKSISASIAFDYIE